MAKNEDTFLTVNELADLMKVTPLTVRRWMAQGKVPFLRIGDDEKSGTIRFSLKQIINHCGIEAEKPFRPNAE